MKSVLVIAPHPDDETLGCGGTLLRHKSEGDSIHWLIATRMDMSIGFSEEQIAHREAQLRCVTDVYGFNSVNGLDFITTRLDEMPMGDVVGSISSVIKEISPHTIYLPYRGDVHTDHRVVFDAVISCTKWFRYPCIKRILSYETLSETEFGINPDSNGFRPNVFVDISTYMDKKLEILGAYATELGAFPFPRSIEAVQAQALLRGATAGCTAAEAFMLLKEIV
jgi:LmbE family N-acetylglucosaminyl deacetylase